LHRFTTEWNYLLNAHKNAHSVSLAAGKGMTTQKGKLIHAKHTMATTTTGHETMARKGKLSHKQKLSAKQRLGQQPQAPQYSIRHWYSTINARYNSQILCKTHELQTLLRYVIDTRLYLQTYK